MAIEVVERTLTLACPECGQVNTVGVQPRPVYSVLCGGCRQQFMVRGAEVWPRPEDTPCDFECGDVDPFGFVPEAGCPVHDGDDGAEEEGTDNGNT